MAFYSKALLVALELHAVHKKNVLWHFIQNHFPCYWSHTPYTPYFVFTTLYPICILHALHWRLIALCFFDLSISIGNRLPLPAQFMIPSQ